MLRKRKLVAGLNCRVQSTRLYGKPLQMLDIEKRLTILEHIIATLRSNPVINKIALGIAKGRENAPFVRIAEKHGLSYVWGDELDGLQRLIDCGRKTSATDVFRVTTEDPFPFFEGIENAWSEHLERENDVTVCDQLPVGCGFQIYRMGSLQVAHAKGSCDERSADIGLYIRRNRDRFRVEIMRLPAHLERLDLRFTVDYPEDLYVCRQVYNSLKEFSPLIPLEKAIHFIDDHPELKRLLRPFGPYVPVWT